MKHSWNLVLNRLVIVLFAVILLVPPAALPFSDPLPEAFAQTTPLPPTYLDTFGELGNGDGQFGSNGPWGIDVDGSGNVWVMDYKNEHAQKFDSSGNFLSIIGSNGNNDNQFKNNGPRDVAIDSTGAFWITDTKQHQIKKFNSDGTFSLKVGSSSGNTDTKFNQPSGVAVDSSDNVYVADMKNEKIKKYDSAGNHLLTFGSNGNGDGQFGSDGPYGVAIDSSGNIWVADANKHRINKFDSSGEFLLRFGSNGAGDTQFKSPRALAIDSFDNVWIADNNNDRIVAYDSSGNFLTKYGTKNFDTGFTDNGPKGIAFEAGTNVFYVTDTKGNQIHKLQNNLTLPVNLPGVPTNLTATAGDTEVALSWVAPTENGGAEIDYYAVLSREANSGSWSLLGNIPGTSTIVTGLTNDQEYEFAVSAHNSAGDGIASSVTETPVTSTSPLDPPNNLTATAGDTEVALSWVAPTSGSSDIGFDSIVDNSGNLCNDSSCDISITIAEGDNRMIVIATADEDGSPDDVTSIDVGSNSDVGIFVGRENVGTSTDQQVELWRIMESDITTGSNTITVNYASSISGGGIVAMSYSNVAQQAEESENSSTVVNSINVSTDVTTLTDGALIISVVGNGESGSYSSHGSDQVEGADFATNSGVMSVTNEIKTTAGSDTQSHAASGSANRHAQYVAAFAPASGGATVTDYKIEYSANSGSTWSVFAHGDTSTTETVTGLTNDTEYSFRVSSVNSGVSSIPSNTATATPISVGDSTTISARISASSNDAEEYPDGDMLVTGSSLDFIDDGSEDNQAVGLRFPGIQIPSGATIQSVTIQFTTTTTSSSTTNITIYGEDTASASAYSNSDDNITDRTKTSTSISWSDISAWNTVNESGSNQKTPNLTSIVQEIITSNGWSSGDPIAFIFEGSGDRHAFSYDSSTSKAPLLEIVYSTVGGAIPDTPTGLTATAGDTEVSLSWTAADSLATDYIVEYRPTITTASSGKTAVCHIPPGNPDNAHTIVIADSAVDRHVSQHGDSIGACESNDWITFDDGTGTSTSVTVTGLTNDVEYEFQVSAINSEGTSPASTTATATPLSDTTDPTTTIEVRVSHDDDDAEEDVEGSNSGEMYLDSSDLELTEDGSEQEIGLRFNNITIPSNAVITSAYVQFTVDETDSESTNLTIFAEDTDNSLRFNDDDDNISDRPKTTASTSWSPAAWNNVGAAGDDQKTAS